MAQYQPMYDSFNRMPERYVPTARMGVSANVYLPGSDVDFYTGQLKPEHQRRHRTQAQRLERAQLERREQKKQALQKEMEKGGVRIQIWKGILICWIFLCICGAGLLWQMGQIVACQNEINRQQALIDEYRRANAELEEQIAAASDPAVICYAASQELNMIRQGHPAHGSRYPSAGNGKEAADDGCESNGTGAEHVDSHDCQQLIPSLLCTSDRNTHKQKHISIHPSYPEIGRDVCAHRTSHPQARFCSACADGISFFTAYDSNWISDHFAL